MLRCCAACSVLEAPGIDCLCTKILALACAAGHEACASSRPKWEMKFPPKTIFARRQWRAQKLLGPFSLLREILFTQVPVPELPPASTNGHSHMGASCSHRVFLHRASAQARSSALEIPWPWLTGLADVAWLAWLDWMAGLTCLPAGWPAGLAWLGSGLLGCMPS